MGFWQSDGPLTRPSHLHAPREKEPMRRFSFVLAVLLCALPLLAACGDEESDGTTPAAGTSASIEIEFEGDKVTPNGERVEVGAGEPVELVVKSDQPGELHVHSTPEQVLSYGAGTTTLKLTLDEPGVVDVEAHDLEIVVVQLEVS